MSYSYKMCEMSSTDSLSTIIESFQRLENFPTYSSCIKCFGKSIIPPLLTREQRQDILQLRSAAVKIEADISDKGNEHLALSDRVEEVYSRDEEYLTACDTEDLASYDETAQFESSALHTSKERDFHTSSTLETTLLLNEMHISISKIPSSDICSTVHKDVIVSSNVINTNKETSINEAQHITSSKDQSSNNPECHLYQVEDILGSSEVFEAPVQMCSVSEDEHDSITESAEFESLPTVINARRLIAQDTDNESNATCLSQSTDLEKYMDSSIDYSSPEDVCTIAPSSQNISARSDDASSETLVNTESELMPCASSMAVLHSDDTHSEITDDQAGLENAFLPQRAHSVDSYVKMLKSTTNSLPIRKSQSEPSNTESKKYNISRSNLSITAIQHSKNKNSGNAPVSDTETCLASQTKADIKKSLKRKHVRSNSYTLDHPSPALIMAHANCNCSVNSPDSPPHSCLDDKIVSPPNPAFKKEKVNIVLPPTSERDKFFPVLSAVCLQTNMAGGDNNEKFSSPIMDGFVDTEIQLLEDGALNSDKKEDIPPSRVLKQVQNSEENSNTESVEDNSEVVSACGVKAQGDIQEIKQTIMIDEESGELKSDDIKEFFKEVIRDVKEIQKNRVNQFLEEQNKLWFQMQEEFKEQERLLCEKMNIVNMSSFSDGAHPMSYQFSDVNIKNCSVIENNVHKLHSNNASYPNANSHLDEECLPQRTTEIESYRVDNAEQLSNQNCGQSYFSNPVLDITSPPNFHITKHLPDSVDSSQSNTSFYSANNTRDDSTSSSQLIGHSSSLSITTNDSLPSNSVHNQVRPTSFQSNLSSNALVNDKKFKNLIPNVLSDRSDSVSIMSQTSVDEHCKITEVSGEGYQNSSKSGLAMQSVNINGLGATDGLETKYSSTTFRSSSNLSQYSDLSKTYSESQFLNVNCPACASLSPTNICNCVSDQGHGECRNVCTDCHVHLNNFCKHLFRDNSPGDDNKNNATAIPPVECAVRPFSSQEESATSLSINSLPLPKNELTITKMSFRNSNNNTLDFNFSDTSDSGATEQSSLLNNNLRSKVHSFQNTLVMNEKNNLSDDIISEDKSYGEEEIRAINDLVQSSYTKSYSCQLNEDYCTALIAANNLTQNQTHLQHCQSLYQISSNGLSTNEKGASKKTISTSLTNLKRRQSREIIKDPILLKKFEKLPALVKGYLTRRLFKTERVQDLIKTLQDTAVLLGKLSQELNLKGNSVSESDVDLHKQLIIQLMTSFENLYDIFCTLGIKEQMEIISESRNFRLKKKAMEKKDSEASAVAENCSSSPNKKPKLSAATLKALERKRSCIDSRTFTIDDFKSCKQKCHSVASSSKSHSISPTRVYKTSVGTSMKRKTTSVRKTSPWK